MFQKILIAEDIDAISQAMVESLQSLSIKQVDSVKYCDDAYLKIKKAILDKQPYDLLITDLSFKSDHRISKLKSGEELIEAVSKVTTNIKTIVFSIEDKSFLIQKLQTQYKIDAYVLKGRNSLENLKKTVTAIFNQEKSAILTDELRVGIIEIESYDITILNALSNGLSISEISDLLKTKKINPSSTSSIEKRINKLKIHFKAINNVHLIANTKDLGII